MQSFQTLQEKLKDMYMYNIEKMLAVGNKSSNVLPIQSNMKHFKFMKAYYI